MLRLISPLMLALAALIHLLPVTGILGTRALSKLYGVTVASPDLVILMRHRAAMFGILGAFMLVSCYRAELCHAAYFVGLVSALSFLVIAGRTGYNAKLARVVVMDIIATVALTVGYLTELIVPGD